ncbi:MAG TPA: TonB family protein [Patescibacteria group bacterium]|nr:TonB family protein [Patescibacteria group bacterium]
MTAALNHRSTAPYGARQLNEYIGRSTYRAFFITIAMLTALGLLSSFLNVFERSLSIPAFIPNLPNTTVIHIKPPTVTTPKLQGLSGSESTAPAAPGTNIPEIANFKPVPNSLPTDPIKFDTPAALTGTIDPGLGLGGTSPGGTSSGQPSQNGEGTGLESGSSFIPDKWEFNPVEKEPQVNKAQLTKNIVYPELARRSGVEGKVILRILVGGNGKVLDMDVVSSRNETLTRAAIDAVLKTTFTPAEQNGQFVNCWVTLPVDFQIR